MRLTCCEKAGQFCSTYNRSNLFGRIFEISHGINCTWDQYMLIKVGLLKEKQPQVETPVAAIQAKNFECNCVGPGKCSYFKTALTKRAWELTHGVNCTEEQQIKIQAIVETKLKGQSRDKVVVVATDETLTLKPKGCGCSGK